MRNKIENWKRIFLSRIAELWEDSNDEPGYGAVVDTRINIKMNTPIVGRIYHVVDKTTGEVIKVGSTVCALNTRWYKYDKKKYSNHFLSLTREIKSSDADRYEPNKSDCPFLWHLVAAEHLEMLGANTYRISRLSNQQSPLDQKFVGFDGVDFASTAGRIGGSIRSRAKMKSCAMQGNRNIESGLLLSICAEGGKVQGRRAASSGQIQAIGLTQGRKNASVPGRMTGLGQLAMHNRWHVKRNMISTTCKLCKEK